MNDFAFGILVGSIGLLALVIVTIGVQMMRGVFDADELKDEEEVVLPKDPPLGLLMSMALRYDHALGCAGYYDEMTFGQPVGVTHAQRLDGALALMRQVYDEVSGHGFYSPDKEPFYTEMIRAGRIAPPKGEVGVTAAEEGNH